MATSKRATAPSHSNGSKSRTFRHINDWLASFHTGEAPSSLNYHPKINAEIHDAITSEPAEYGSAICDQLFTLFHELQHRPFVLQFLPSFIIAYYDVLYQRHSESVDATTKDVCSTIDTFLVSLYNLGVTDDGSSEKIQQFRIANLTQPSIYHTPNPDHYAPTPLTQHEISKHETQGEVIRMQSFAPLGSVNSTTREQILWFLLIQYGMYVSMMDRYSRQAYIRMCKKLLGQGFSFDNPTAAPAKSIIPPTGRRIYLSSRMMTELLGTLFHLKSYGSSDDEASQSMLLLKKRAEYEMYAEVLLMTESMGALHEFETQRPNKQDTIGIEIELPPTVDVVRQKRTATTTRSMKNRQRSSKHDEPIVSPESNPNGNASVSPSQHRRVLNVVDENSTRAEYENRNNSNNKDVDLSPVIDHVRTGATSPIGPVASSPSPVPSRRHKSSFTTSAQSYHRIANHPTASPILQTRRVPLDDEEYEETESITFVTRPRTSSVKHGERRDMIATVRFIGQSSVDNDAQQVEETYL